MLIKTAEHRETPSAFLHTWDATERQQSCYVQVSGARFMFLHQATVFSKCTRCIALDMQLEATQTPRRT